MGVPEEVANELAKGVQNLEMAGRVPDLNAQGSVQEEEEQEGRISGLNSFATSVEASLSGKTDTESKSSLSIHERLQLLKEQKMGFGSEKKGAAKLWSSAVKDIDKQKNKKGAKASFIGSIKDMEKNGTEVAQFLESFQKEGESPAKHSGQSTLQRANLTGAHVETR